VISGLSLSNNSVTAAQIANATITTAQIAASTIVGGNIAATTIAGGNLINNTITATQIANGTITTTQIAAGTITASNLGSSLDIHANLANNTLPLALLAPGAPGVTQMLIVDETASPQVVKAVTLTGAIAIDHTGNVTLTSNTLSSVPIVVVRELDAAGTSAGGFTGATWTARQFNDVADPRSIGASISTGSVQVPAGTYLVMGSAPAYSVGRHRCVLTNVTGAQDTWTTICLGSSEIAGPGSNSRSWFRAFVVLSVTSKLQIFHICETTKATNGLGIASNFAGVLPALGVYPNVPTVAPTQPSTVTQEVYSELLLIKVV
jgi:hypothetical protein